MNRAEPNFHKGNIEGGLYFSQLKPSTVELLKQKIQSLNPLQAIQWKIGGGRTTYEFGISMKEGIYTGKIVHKKMDDLIVQVRKELVELFHDHLTEKSPEAYCSCTLNIYTKGQGFIPHIDRLWGGPDIIGLVIEPDQSPSPEIPPARLYFRHPETQETISLIEKSGTAYMFQGEMRTKWKHALPKVATYRASLQFRAVRAAEVEKATDLPQEKKKLRERNCIIL